MIKIKVNDKVNVIAGKDKGKGGKVTQVLPSMGKVVVEGINVMYKHIKSRKKGEKGQRIQFNGPIAVSNVALICPKCSKTSKVGLKISVNESSKKTNKVRFCKKCKEVID